MSLFITAYQNRTTQELITITGKDSAGNTTIPNIDPPNKLRVKIGRSGETPIIDLVSGTELANGTRIVVENPAVFTIVGSDFAAMAPGTYDIEVIVVDAGDHSRNKIADEGIFILNGTQGGNLS